MNSWKRTLWILWSCVLLSNSSYTMAIPFLPLYLLDLGVPQSAVAIWTGLLHSLPFLVGMCMSPLWGAMADKYGKRKMVVRAGISLAIVYALFAFVQSPWQLIAVRSLQGFVSGFVPAALAIVASAVPEKKLGWSLGIMQSGVMSGGIVGPLFGALLALWFGQRMSFVAAAVLIGLATLSVILWVREGRTGGEGGAPPVERRPVHAGHTDDRIPTPTRQSGEGTRASPPAGSDPEPGQPAGERKPKRRRAERNPAAGIWSAFRDKWVLRLLLLLFLYQFSLNMIQPFLPLHIADLQGDVRDAVLSSGIVFSLIAIAGMIASPLWGRAGETRGYGRMLSLCLIASGCIASAHFFVEPLWLFAVAQFVFGLLIAGIAPAVNTLMVKHTDASFRGRSFGLSTSFNQLGAMTGPLAAGGIVLFLDIRWVFVAAGVMLAGTGALVLARRKLARSQARLRPDEHAVRRGMP